jgi:hypothetical protein
MDYLLIKELRNIKFHDIPESIFFMIDVPLAELLNRYITKRQINSRFNQSGCCSSEGSPKVYTNIPGGI